MKRLTDFVSPTGRYRFHTYCTGIPTIRLGNTLLSRGGLLSGGGVILCATKVRIIEGRSSRRDWGWTTWTRRFRSGI